MSLSARLRFKKTIRDNLFCVNLKVVFKIKNRLSSKFDLQKEISKDMRSFLCYKVQCSIGNAAYYGKIKHHFKVGVSEHMGVTGRTGKTIQSIKNSGARDHMFRSGCRGLPLLPMQHPEMAHINFQNWVLVSKKTVNKTLKLDRK